LQQQVATGPVPKQGVEGIEGIKIVSKNSNLATWSNKITESGKFKIGIKDNAFSSVSSRNAYIRLLMNGFNTLPEFKTVSFEELFTPTNGYANFQTLLNMVQVPVDHDGFYINDKKKTHLKSTFLSSPAK